MDRERAVDRERIWAPWRIDYVSGGPHPLEPVDAAALLPGADQDCFLCRGVPEGDDRARLVIDRGEYTLTVLNRYPYNNGHLLLAPKRHLARLDELAPEVHAELCSKLNEWIKRLEEAINPDGFNLGLNLGRVAGAGLPGHVHWHVVPRWNGDTNFMPTIAGARVIPQSLDALWEALVEQK